MYVPTTIGNPPNKTRPIAHLLDYMEVRYPADILLYLRLYRHAIRIAIPNDSIYHVLNIWINWPNVSTFS